MKPSRTIAYFSAEYSVADSLPIYAGGLGILAGDTVQEAGAQGRSFHAFGLVYHEAFTAGDTDNRPIMGRLSADGFEIVRNDANQPLILEIPVSGEMVKVRAWRKYYQTACLTLLDTRLEDNSPGAQKITNHLYDSLPGVMLQQQVVLGLGAIALMENLGIEPDIYHLNEGHMAFVGLAVALRHQRLHPELSLTEAIAAVKPKLVATKHTILAGAGLMLEHNELEAALGPVLAAAKGSAYDLMTLGGRHDGRFSTTKFLLALTHRANGVSAIHVRSEAEAHPNSPLITITNGVFVSRWRAASLDGTPLEFDDHNLWQMHRENRGLLLDYVKAETGKRFHPDHLTVVWARRMTAYKRPELLVSDLDRLIALAHHSTRPIQFVVAGQANLADSAGLALMNQVIAASRRPELADSFAYLPHYNPMTARLLVQGGDLWLNTPIRGQEACGTSGMKASLNGALQLSTSDGWIDEIEIEPLGWELPVDEPGPALYHILEHEVAPLFYNQSAGLPQGWIKKMRAAIDLTEHQFTATRMLNEYYDRLYQG
ncbi:MAG TPA: alpha-glucan family phosphorylase [Candidatus Saccharimonadia bacterium]|nr:alpha-glucan family phosphorylase [Candidatus Saccharimonadia bacterium]